MCHFRLMSIFASLIAICVGAFGMYEYVTDGPDVIHEPMSLILFTLLFAVGVFGFIYGVFEKQLDRLFPSPDKWF